MNKYLCLCGSEIKRGDYKIVTLREEDINKIKDWRNAQIDVLRQKEYLTEESQKEYYKQVIQPTFNQKQPSQILFSYIYKDECIGYGGFVHIDWNSLNAELSFLTETSRNKDVSTFRSDYTNYLFIIKQLASSIGFRKIYTYAYDIRQYLIDTLESNGFVQEGFLKDHILIKNNFIAVRIHSFFINNNKQIAEEFENVLITAVSTKIPLIENVKIASKKIDQNIKIFGADLNPQCLGTYFLDCFWQMPNIDTLSADDIRKYCIENSINAIIPTRDGELAFFAKIKESLLKDGISVMVSDIETINFCLDKLKFYKDSIITKTPIIPTFIDINEIETSKYVVKERYGAGSDKIGINLTKEQAISHSRKIQNPIYQPFISGKEASIDIYINKSRKMQGIVMRYRDEVVNGESRVTTTFYDEKLKDLCEDFILTKSFYGHIILQCIIDENQNYHIIECNPRFGGASTVSIFAGLDSFYWFLLESRNVDVSNYNTQIRKDCQIKQIRHPKDKIIIQ